MKKHTLKRCVVTGAAGQIAYSLIFKIASGELFGRDVQIDLRLLDIAEMEASLKGLEYELEDCAFSTLSRVISTSKEDVAFDQVDIAFLVGAKPRTPGMERKDLLQENAKIFVAQGKSLNSVASRDVKVLVVGNPCNTNCLITSSYAEDLPNATFTAMTKLDELRAESYLARSGHLHLKDVSGVTIWGNHSSTQVVDASHIPKRTHFTREFLENDLMPFIQKRGAQVLQARGKSSAASASNAALLAMKNLITQTHHFSAGVCSNGNPYGIRNDLVFSFPCRTNEDGSVEICPHLAPEEWLVPYIKMTEKELVEERDQVRHLLGPNG